MTNRRQFIAGVAAASAATVFPFPSRNFRINSCAVASVNCIVLTPQTVPVGNPLKELSLSFFREQDDESQQIKARGHSTHSFGDRFAPSAATSS